MPVGSMGAWNWLDSLLASVVVLSVVAAAVKGFVRELISLASAVVALVIAALGYQRVARGFEDLTRSREVALAAGFLLLFLGTLMIGAILSAVSRRMVKAAGIQSVDRFLGGAFGLLRGLVIACVLLMALVAFEIKPAAVQHSLLAPYIATGARVIALVMPRELKQEFQSGFEKFKETLIRGEKKLPKG